MHTLLIIYVVFVGACLGSFANVLIARLPEGLSVVRPRSRCGNCHQPIAWYDNIPLVSFLMLSARCRHCGVKISIRYFIVEALMAVLAWALFLQFGLTWQWVFWLLLSTGLLAITFIDLQHWYIPDVIVMPLVALCAAMAWLPGGVGWKNALLGLIPAFCLWLIGFAFMQLTGREGLGLGDVKLLGLLGLALGLKSTLVVAFLAAVQGLMIGLLTLKRERQTTQDGWTPPERAIPFGPFLVLGAFEVVLLPEIFLHIPDAVLRWLVEAIS
jgi:leader peptidase (prepilin peptidase) / N-methyltransferase